MLGEKCKFENSFPLHHVFNLNVSRTKHTSQSLESKLAKQDLNLLCFNKNVFGKVKRKRLYGSYSNERNANVFRKLENK